MAKTPKQISITNRKKVFFNKPEITKGEVVDYYQGISDWIIPFIKNRPLMLQRFPDGIEKDGFYQKEASEYFPDWIERVSVEKEDGSVNHVVCNNKKSLIYLANQGTVTFHSWLSTADKINYPDKVILDLDPPADDFEIARRGAILIHEILNDLKIEGRVLITGSSGVHIYIYVDQGTTFDPLRDMAVNFTKEVEKLHEEIFTTEFRKEKRAGKLFLDIKRIAYAQTAVVPYSLRPLEGAPVATPISWEELRNKKIHAQSYNLKNINRRLAKIEDPWGDEKKVYSFKILRDCFASLNKDL